MRQIGVFAILVACSGDKTEDSGLDAVDTDPPPSACGAVTEGYSVRLEGLVHLQGQPVEGAEITVRENQWNAGRTHGVGMSASDGAFVVDVTELVSVEDCWGTALDYTADVIWMEWEWSRDLNATLYGAILSDGVADMRSNPIELDPEWRPPLDTGGL